MEAPLNVEQMADLAPLIEEAARREAELVVVGETLTYAGVGSSYENCAESIPGRSTDYFGELAKKLELYFVAGLIERDWHELFNRIMSRPTLWARMADESGPSPVKPPVAPSSIDAVT